MTDLADHTGISAYFRTYVIVWTHHLLTYSFYIFYGRAKDSPNQAQRRLWNQRFSASPHNPSPSPSLSPRDLMWQQIKDEYTPIHHASALACQTPDNGKPVAAVRGAIKTHSRLITSTMFRIATGHCFDARYSQRFRPDSDDILICPCEHNQPHHTSTPATTYSFQCTRYTKEEEKIPTMTMETPNHPSIRRRVRKARAFSEKQ